MLAENAHLSEQELMLAADGELPARRRAEVTAHLEACWTCREHMATLQSTIADFVRARNHEFNDQVPSEAGPRALLRTRLAEASAMSSRPTLRSFAFPAAYLGRFALVGAAFLAVLLVIFQSTVNAEGPKPKLAITPGETRSITLEEVCRYPHAEVVSENIPAEMRGRVFAAYGLKASQRDQFEVDYLITPDLGGTESIRNLWPQPYSVRWNARVKDRLEERLHELVCGGKLDLATAQRDIAVDWIAAYRKYVDGAK
jgi:hypothetical protein